jgi:hypothetical protein
MKTIISWRRLQGRDWETSTDVLLRLDHPPTPFPLSPGIPENKIMLLSQFMCELFAA